MVKRFVERFQLWREEKRQEREDSEGAWLLFLAAVVVAQTAYSIIASGQLASRAVIATGVVLLFVVMYLRTSPFTWLVPLFGGVALAAEAAFLYFTAPSDSRLFAQLLLPLVISTALVVYSLRLRRRFSRENVPTI